MTCDELLARLDDFVDRNLSPKELDEAERHLEVCVTCLEKVRFERALLDGIRKRLRRIALPPDLLTLIRLRLCLACGD
ncbi:MAG TPA: zf-HC2 domain-containing protein [Gemmatimonadales bacterium]|nr:zf-HC2 domain-containing protein [Gemmatimonadales bacterium]